jgi:hypothetical protein
MVFPVQDEIASGKKRPRNDSLNSYRYTTISRFSGGISFRANPFHPRHPRSPTSPQPVGQAL